MFESYFVMSNIIISNFVISNIVISNFVIFKLYNFKPCNKKYFKLHFKLCNFRTLQKIFFSNFEFHLKHIFNFPFRNLQTVLGNAVQDSEGERETRETPLVRPAQLRGSTGLTHIYAKLCHGFRPGVHNSNLIAGQFFQPYPRVRINFCYLFKEKHAKSTKFWTQRAKCGPRG